MKATIGNGIKKCETCIRMNKKKKRSLAAIEKRRRFEKVGLDVMRIDGKLIFLAIDYHTQILYRKEVKNLTANSILHTDKQ